MTPRVHREEERVAGSRPVPRGSSRCGRGGGCGAASVLVQRRLEDAVGQPLQGRPRDSPRPRADVARVAPGLQRWVAHAARPDREEYVRSRAQGRHHAGLQRPDELATGRVAAGDEVGRSIRNAGRIRRRARPPPLRESPERLASIDRPRRGPRRRPRLGGARGLPGHRRARGRSLGELRVHRQRQGHSRHSFLRLRPPRRQIYLPSRRHLRARHRPRLRQPRDLL
mmetsp:Transcript_18014/g.56519  ORF Transcript_18014/g.56519 Transcript_18014/m.56519 type:complete len:226 (-) Transcript_18014:383-1060(-)